MASTLMVTTSELRKRADELESLNEAFLGKVNGLKDDETLLGQSYVGEAQKQFHDRAEAANVSVAASRR